MKSVFFPLPYENLKTNFILILLNKLYFIFIFIINFQHEKRKANAKANEKAKEKAKAKEIARCQKRQCQRNNAKVKNTKTQNTIITSYGCLYFVKIFKCFLSQIEFDQKTIYCSKKLDFRNSKFWHTNKNFKYLDCCLEGFYVSIFFNLKKVYTKIE